jgi:hypothetical protein
MFDACYCFAREGSAPKLVLLLAVYTCVGQAPKVRLFGFQNLKAKNLANHDFDY